MDQGEANEDVVSEWRKQRDSSDLLNVSSRAWCPKILLGLLQHNNDADDDEANDVDDDTLGR